jgi:hypothetical protein
MASLSGGKRCSLPRVGGAGLGASAMDRFIHDKKRQRDPTGTGSGNKPAPVGNYVEAQNVHDARSGMPQAGPHRMQVH